MRSSMKLCHRCSHPFTEPGQPGFNNTCPKCGISLHACGNCRSFVPRGNVRCLIPGTERVVDHSAANRCQQFEFVDVAQASAEGSQTPPREQPAMADPRDQWKNLFK